MITYLKGALTYKTPTYVILEANNIGYEVHISLHTYNKLEEITSERTDQCKLLTYLQVKEDAHTLFGFAESSEKILFLQLISVNGIGANVARTILSSAPPGELEQAITREDVDMLKAIKGIGPKIAKRIVLELRDKLTREPEAETMGKAGISGTAHNTLKSEALSALIGMGVPQKAAEQSVQKTLKAHGSSLTLEEVIKIALKRS